MVSPTAWSGRYITRENHSTEICINYSDKHTIWETTVMKPQFYQLLLGLLFLYSLVLGGRRRPAIL